MIGVSEWAFIYWKLNQSDLNPPLCKWEGDAVNIFYQKNQSCWSRNIHYCAACYVNCRGRLSSNLRTITQREISQFQSIVLTVYCSIWQSYFDIRAHLLMNDATNDVKSCALVYSVSRVRWTLTELVIDLPAPNCNQVGQYSLLRPDGLLVVWSYYRNPQE